MNRRIGLSSVVSAVAVVVLLFAGCGDQVPTEVQLRPDGLRVGSVAQAVVSPVPYRAGTFTREIGPEGGTLEFGIGSLSFPEGALAGPTAISATVDGRSVGVEFEPHGLLFPSGSEPMLTFRSQGDWGRSGIVLYVDNFDIVLQVLNTYTSRDLSSVQARLTHFSKYIFGAN